MALVVLEHHLDEAASVYRIVVAEAVEHVVQAHDETGEPLYLPAEPMTDEAGDPILRDEDGQPFMAPPEPMTEIRTEYHAVEDFVFDAGDERWQRRPPEDVAAEQRDIVRARFDQRAREAESAELEREASLHELPGSGQAL